MVEALPARSHFNLETEFCPPIDDCRALLARIRASREFQRATRLRCFLTYVVERKLAGCTDDITEVQIGHHVFGRPLNYNPGDDSIVRTVARTLRDRLDKYFSGDGAHEPVIIEIPRGAYVPVFIRRAEKALLVPPLVHPRLELDRVLVPPAIPVSAPISRRRWLWFGGSAAAVGSLVALERMVGHSSLTRSRNGASEIGRVRFECSDARLTQGFADAKERALSCVYTGDPVGDWYTSAGVNRTFCMRDVSHESLGAAVLGLTRHTANMLRCFARSIAASRNWCGYWIITKDGFPAPTTYNGDSDFGYCLPANFDLVRACYKQLCWTGDRTYLDAVFSGFYDRTVTSYIAAWDKKASGRMRVGPEWRRLHGSYNQGPLRFETGADLPAAQYASYVSYAGIQELKGTRGSLSWRMAEEYRTKAAALRACFNSEWWDPRENRFYSGVFPDGSFSSEYVDQSNVYPLWFGMPEDGLKTKACLDLMEQHRPRYDSTFSYFPEVLYHYGRHDAAYRSLLEIARPGFSGLTETAFAVVGAIASGLMGISPDVPRGHIETLPRLTGELKIARLNRIPIAQNEITVEHQGTAQTTFTNEGPALQWKAAFPVTNTASNRRISIDGAFLRSTLEHRNNGTLILSALVPVGSGKSRTARLL